jgi:T-complex protein 1 subunit eta
LRAHCLSRVLQGIVSNDGAKIMSLLDIVHPAAKTLVDIAQAQDAEIGDGTTTVVLLAGEFLKAAKSFIEDGVHPQIVIRVRCCGAERTICGPELRSVF